MQYTGYIWRRHHNCIRFTLIGCTVKIAFLHPVGIPFCFCFVGYKILTQFHVYNIFVRAARLMRTLLHRPLFPHTFVVLLLCYSIDRFLITNICKCTHCVNNFCSNQHSCLHRIMQLLCFLLRLNIEIAGLTK